MERILLIINIIFIIIILMKLFFTNRKTETVQLIDLKNEITELKTKQLESQNLALQRQQELFNETQKNMSNQLNDIMKIVNDNMTNSQKNMNSQMNNTEKLYGEIQKKMGNLESSTQNINHIAKDISSLQNILKSPKLRGNIGEFFLENLLKQIFPKENYDTQYSFKNGTTVDAIIKLSGKIISIDSKFPLESFQRLIEARDNEENVKPKKREFIKSVKERVDEIASKYINPEEGTFDFAMMYIPAENVFYEIFLNDSYFDCEFELFNYCINKNVIPVSPNSFYAYLMVIVFGLKGLKIERETQEIIGEFSKIQAKYASFLKNLKLTAKHMKNSYTNIEKSIIDGDNFEEKINKLTGIDIDRIEIDEEISGNE